MLFRTTGVARRLLLGAAFLGFACRAWIPAGYMPATAADGGPVVLCPGGPGGALIAQLVASRRPLGSHSAAHLAALDHHSAAHLAALDGLLAAHAHDATHAHGAAHAHDATHAHYAAQVVAHPGIHGGSHRGEQDDGHPGFDASYCPLGASAAFAAFAPSFDIGLLDLTFSLDATAEAPIAVRAPVRAYESRAPPFV